MSIMKPPFHTELNLGHRLSQGLVGCWLFNEAPPPLGSAMDLSGNGHHGTLVSDAVSVPGKWGNAIRFDGAGDYVEVPDGQWLDDLAGEGSIVVWVLPEVFNNGGANGFPHMVSRRGTGGDIWELYYNSSGQPQFYSASTGQANVQGAASPGSVWEQIGVTWATNDVKLYRNGVIIATDTSFSSIGTGTTSLSFGDLNNGERSLQGSIGSVLIYNRALNASETANLYLDPYQMFKRGG